ncbi:MAG: tyrosine--tRNA ligase [Candidatus Pacebacteria bacterium CG10_big_fil_rev_8_21_14_0_10_42_12]|nr:tyrosine--tRNA ligase [Candidatus Paceibacterota bacterium]PIR62670.1 MAG: tyrosine--tRNA ligase [Candidatus Pacebacteria bacterium CG10_big_fil_rev_8_21_14_0_10_42_12]
MTEITPKILTRGVEQILPDIASLEKLMSEKKIRIYLGIDPTGSLLTLGHSVVLRKLQQFADAGHQVILLIGNGTVRIGDPTGRDSTRPVLTDEAIEENFKTWKSQANKILDFDKIEIRYNGDWLDKLTYADMIKLLAKTTVQQLTERDMFQERIKNEQPIFGHEILYPLLQGYDSVAMDVDLEIGGSDQLFNMMMGRQLQRSYNNREKWVLTCPIINGTDGRKMSKSYGNFVSLTEEPNQMYGKLMSIADEQIIEYFTLLTDTPMTEIESMSQAMTAGENPMQFKQLLAREITKLYHDEEAARLAEEHFRVTVQEGSLPTEIPEINFQESELSLLDLLHRCEPNESRGNLRRLIEQGGVTLFPEETKPNDPTKIISIKDIDAIKMGKRKFYRIIHD